MADKDKFADEMLTDDELDQVAGGTPGELADDSRFLNVLLNGEEKNIINAIATVNLQCSGVIMHAKILKIRGILSALK